MKFEIGDKVKSIAECYLGEEGTVIEADTALCLVQFKSNCIFWKLTENLQKINSEDDKWWRRES